MIRKHILLYSVVLMEDVFQIAGPPGFLLQEHRGGEYLYTKCHKPARFRPL
jgi:hypothetical protein